MLLLLGRKEDGSIVLSVQAHPYGLTMKKVEVNGYAPDDFIVNGIFDRAAYESIDLSLNKMWDTDYRDVLLYYVENSKNTSLRLQIIE